MAVFLTFMTSAYLLQKYNSQLFYQQNEFIWEKQRIVIQERSYDEPYASPMSQKEGYLSLGLTRILGKVVLNKSSLKNKSSRPCVFRQW